MNTYPCFINCDLLKPCLLAVICCLTAVGSALGQTPGDPSSVGVSAPDRLQLRDGDRVVMIGATFIERAQAFGHLESALTAAAASRGNSVTFRNLGWSADTADSQSRGIFDPAEAGYQRLLELVAAENPTLVIICYGQNEAIGERFTPELPETARDTFRQRLTRLVGDLKTDGRRLILLTPTMLLPTAPPVPDPTRWNSRIARIAEDVTQVGRQNDVPVVDLFRDWTESLLSVAQSTQLNPAATSIPQNAQALAERLSDNGVHLNDSGYRAAGLVVADRMTAAHAAALSVHLAATPDQVSAGGLQITPSTEPGVEPAVFRCQPDSVSPLPLLVEIDAERFGTDITVHLRTGSEETIPLDVLQPRMDDSGVVLRFGLPELPQYAALRNVVVRKNELYFHRWRPQNVTYLFGFRKHEQGNNASEIAEFDPFIRDCEERIAGLAVPAEFRLVVSAAAAD